MPRPVGLPRFVANWISQVAASLGATLAAAAIYAALPSPNPAAPRPELTSGGKFAARIASPVAYDGLDTMPSPRVVPVDLPAADGPARARAAPPAGDRAARTPKPVRPAAHAGPRHAATPAQPEAVVAAPASPDAEAGWASRTLSTAGEAALGAWSFTASVGDAVTARILPRLP